MRKYIVGLGEILFDCLPEGKKLGGAPANFAYHVSRSLAFLQREDIGEGLAVSAIGNDENGQEIIRQLSSYTPPLGIEGLQKVSQPTGTVQVTLSDNGIPQYDIREGVAYDNIPWNHTVEDIAKNTRAVCFGTLAQRSRTSRSTIRKFLDTMPEKGTMKIFDINLRQEWYTKRIIEESMKRCNVMKINDEEIVTIAKMFKSQLPLFNSDIAGRLLQPVEFMAFARKMITNYKVRMIILTCGAYGSYVITDEIMHYEATPQVKVADTVGAGDSFTGAFCAAILAGKSIEEAHKIAVSVSAFVCTQAGAMPDYNGLEI